MGLEEDKGEGRQEREGMKRIQRNKENWEIDEIKMLKEKMWKGNLEKLSIWVFCQ